MNSMGCLTGRVRIFSFMLNSCGCISLNRMVGQGHVDSRKLSLISYQICLLMFFHTFHNNFNPAATRSRNTSSSSSRVCLVFCWLRDRQTFPFLLFLCSEVLIHIHRKSFYSPGENTNRLLQSVVDADCKRHLSHESTKKRSITPSLSFALI